MRAFWQLPLLAAAIYGFHSLADSRALPDNSLVPADDGCNGVYCPVSLASELGEYKAGAREFTEVSKRAFIVPRVPGSPLRIGSPKGSSKGEHDPNAPGGASSNPADPHTGGSSNPADPHPGQSSNPADQSRPAAPARIASDKPGDQAGRTPELLLLGESKDFDTLPPKGRQLDDDVHQAIRNNEPDVTLPKLTDNYGVRDMGRNQRIKAPDLEEPFRDFGVDVTKAKQTATQVVSGKEDQNKPPIVGGRYFHTDKTIVAEDLFAVHDTNPPSQKMRPSDIMFSQWKEFASHINANNGQLLRGMSSEVNQLERFVARNIQGRSIVETIETAHKKTNQPLNAKGVFRRGGE